MYDSPFSLVMGFRSVALRAAGAPLKTIHLTLKDWETKALRASAHKYGSNNGTSRKIDFAHILPIDWP